MYEMFMGPFMDSKPWDMKGIEGLARFLRRAWMLLGDAEWRPGDGAVGLRHRTIKKVGADIDDFRFNTALSALMIYLNQIQDDAKAEGPCRADAETFLTLLHPFAPHTTEEIWEKRGNPGLLARREWPAFDPALARENQVQIAVQVNGKVREHLTIEAGAPKDQVREAALALERVRAFIDGGKVVNVVVVPDRLVNIVIKK